MKETEEGVGEGVSAPENEGVCAPVPSQAVIADWIMTIDTDACIGCEACLSRCWMEALKMDGDVPVRDANRCIGCGVCSYVCPSDAMKLLPRQKVEV